MANKVSYANLKLKPISTTSSFEFGGQKIEVLNYLPIEYKYDLVMITLQKAEQDGVYNPLLLDLYWKNLQLCPPLKSVISSPFLFPV